LQPLRREANSALPIVRAEFHGAQKNALWLTGTVIVTRIEEREHVRGSYDMKMPDGTVIKGVFDAPWQVRSALCG